MFRVPPELQQRISRPQPEGLDFDILFGSEDKADSGFSTFLTDCGGYFKDLLVVVRNNRLIVFDVFGRDLLCGYNFDANEHIVSVDYHRLLSPSFTSTSTDEQDEEVIKNDGCGGLLIGVNNVKSAESFTAIVAINRGDARLIRKLAIPDTIYCVKTLVSSYHMDKTAHLLHPKMRAYPHVVAIGTLRGHCYITHLDVRDEIAPADAKQVKTNRLTDALKSFVEDGKFWFKFSGARERKFFNASDACVSALGFVERARCLLIGLRFGGLVAVSLSDSPSIEPVMVPYTGCEPRFIESLVPENDPRPRLYFFVASNTSESAAHITMYYMDFPQDEQLRINDPNSWQYKELHITEQLKIAAPDMRKFISMRCIVDELKKHHTDLDDTVVNTGPSQDQSRTLLSFFYLARNAETRELQLKGGLFDLNQHYFKRQVPRVAPDGTFAQQCPFVAFYHETPSPEMVASSLHDMIIDPFYLRRYSSNVSDELQMFYPSSYKMDKVYAASGSNMFVLSISSMVEQVLGRIIARLAEHLSDPVPAFKWLSSIGLPIDADTLEPNSREHALAVVLSAIVYHDKLEELNTLVKNGSEEQGITDGLLMEINDWLWQELQKQFKKMNDLMYPLFRGGSTGLNEADQNALMACHSIFRAARYLYTSFMQRSATKMQCISVLEVRSNAAKMFEQSLLLHNYLHQNKILPVCDEVREVISRVRNDMPRRRRNAELRRRELFIEQLIKKLYDYCGSECFWLDRSPIGVYPPTILDLVSLLPLDSVPSRMKRTIILYYLIDFSNVQLMQNKENAEENSLLSTVNYIMSSIGKELKLTEEEADSILESWKKDTEEPETVQPAVLDATGNRGIPSSPNVSRKEMKSELERLVSQPLLEYPPEDVARIKELLFTLYGKCLADVYWNCILFKQKRFQEFDTELKIPENLQEHHIVVHYLKTAIQLRQVRSYNIAYAMWDPSKKLSQEIVDKIKSFNQTTAEPASPHRSVFRQKTNINHRRQSLSAANSSARRGRNLNASGNGMDVSMLSAVDENLDKVEKTPENKCDVTLLDFDNDEDTPKRINQNASPSVLQELREIVRTPRARSRAAALAEGGVNMETTPEHAAPPMPTTHSILKSAKKAPTPSRGGIKWDPNVCTPDDDDALNPPARSSSALSRPDFDDDIEECDQSHVMPKTSSKERVNVNDTPELEKMKSNGEEGECVDNDDDNDDDQLYGEESSRVVEKQASSSVNVSSLSNEEADQDTTAGMISSESIIDLDSPAPPSAVVVETESVASSTEPANVAILQDSQETKSFPDSRETVSSPQLHSHLEKEEESAVPSSQTPLVDYSFSDSSMLSTPGRTTVAHEIPSGSPQTRAILSRSFEAQDAADFEKEVESSFDVLEDAVESREDSVQDKVATVLKRSFEQQDETDFVEVDKAVAATPVSHQNHVMSHIRTQSSVIQTREVDGNVTATVVTVTETETAEAEREPISTAEKVSPKKVSIEEQDERDVTENCEDDEPVVQDDVEDEEEELNLQMEKTVNHFGKVEKVSPKKVSIEEQDERDVTENCEDDEPVVQDDVEDEEEELNLQMEKTVNHFGKAEKVSPKKVSIEEQDERDVTENCEDDEPVVQDDVEDEEEELNLQMEKTVNHFGKMERRLLEMTPKTDREQKVPVVAVEKTAEINVTPRKDIAATVSTVSPVIVAAPVLRDPVTPEKRNTEQALPSATASPSRRSVRLQNRADSEPPKPVPTPKKSARKSVAPSSIPEHDEEAGGTDSEPVRKSTRRRSASTSLAARNAGAISRPGYNAKANDWFAEEEKMLAETFGPKGNLDSRRLRLISAPVAAKAKTTRKKKEDATKEAEEKKPKTSRTRASSAATASDKEAAPKPIARTRSRSASRASAVVPIEEVPEEKTPKKSPTRRSRSASRTVLVDTVTPKKQKQAQLDVVTPVANATSPSRKSRRAASESRTHEVKSTSKRSTKKSVLEVDNVEVTPSRRGRRATDTSVVVKESKTPTKRGRKIAENAEEKNSTSEKATPSKRGRKVSASVV